MSSDMPANRILHYDIFKPGSDARNVQMPEFAQRFITKLQASLTRIQNETMQKCCSSNDVVPKVMSELERSLNAIMKRNLQAVKSISNRSQVNLSELYSQSIRHNNVALKKHLNSMYLTCRVYRELFKEHPVLDNLQLRLISVRCKAIRDYCQNETRRGKIRHLRCGSRNPRSVSTVPRRLKTLVKRIYREVEKAGGLRGGKDVSGAPSWSGDDRQAMYCALEDAVANYYHHHADGGNEAAEEMGASCSSAELAWNLAGLATASNSDLEKALLSDCAGAVLQACDQDDVLEVLGIATDEVARSFASGDRTSHSTAAAAAAAFSSLADDRHDRDPLGLVAMESVIEDYDEYVAGVAEDVNGTVSGTEDDHLGSGGGGGGGGGGDDDMLDFDNFQLVDVWEEHEQLQQQHKTPLLRETVSGVDPAATGPAAKVVVVADSLGVAASAKEDGPPAAAARRKRRSRFAPMTDEELATFLLQQHEQLERDREAGHRLGFCSTFVDEDVSARRDEPLVARTAKLDRSPDNRTSTAVAMTPVVVDVALSMEQEDVTKVSPVEPPAQVKVELEAPVATVPSQEPSLPVTDDPLTSRQPTGGQGPALPDRGDLCKAMLRQFHESLVHITTVAATVPKVISGRGNAARAANEQRRREWRSLTESALAPWRGSSTGSAVRPLHDSRIPGDSSDSVARQIYREVEARMGELATSAVTALVVQRSKKRHATANAVPIDTVAKRAAKTLSTSRDGAGRHQQQHELEEPTGDNHDSHKKRPGAAVAMTTGSTKRQQEQAERGRRRQSAQTGRPKDDSEEATGLHSNSATGQGNSQSVMSDRKRGRASDTTGTGGSSSPERARLRAMMLSYKRDVEKNREGASNPVTTATPTVVTESDTTGSTVVTITTTKKEDIVTEEQLVPESSQRDQSGSHSNGDGYAADGDDECGMAELLSRAASDPTWTAGRSDRDHHSDSDDDDDDEDDEDDDDSEGLVSSSSDNNAADDATSPTKKKLQQHQHQRDRDGDRHDTQQQRRRPSSLGGGGGDKQQVAGRPVAASKVAVTSTSKAEISRMKWLVPPPEAVSVPTIPAPATPFLEDSEEQQCWTGKKVFVVDSHDKGSAIALSVKAFLHKNSARVYDTSNYKQAGKDLHVLVHQDWRFPDCNSTGIGSSSSRSDGTGTGGPSNSSGGVSGSPISLLLLKNNSGVHFLSYADVDSVSRFACQTVFPHSRSCIFLDQHALLGTHVDNVRNMLEFMIAERHSSNRVWCLKIPGSVYRLFRARIDRLLGDRDRIDVHEEVEDGSIDNHSGDGDCGGGGGDELENLRQIDTVLKEYAGRFSKDDSSLCLLELQGTAGGSQDNSGGDDDDISNLQEHVLNQQHFLQHKFRHFCILTDSLNATELDIGFLSIYGVAVLPLNTFLVNKTGTYVRKAVTTTTTAPAAPISAHTAQ